MRNSLQYTCFSLILFPLACHSGPSGGVVGNGAATINQSGLTTTINQTSSNATINWDSFNVGASESVNFIQPSARSATLNNINDANPSTVSGSITSNGRVFLSNPNGFIFSAGSSINVGSLLATTSRVDSFDSDSVNYSAGGDGVITANGNFNSTNEGFIAFFAPSINNQASINSPTGNITFSDTSRGTLYLPNSAGIGFEIQSLDSLNPIGIENTGALTAKGGQVILSSAAVDTTLKNAINNTGIIDVSSISTDGGVIRLTASHGSIDQLADLNADAGDNGNGGEILIIADQALKVSGNYSARGGKESGNGGFVETSGHDEITINANVDTRAEYGSWGEWLIDPANLTISNDSTTPGPDPDNWNVTDLENNLFTTNVSLAATSNITVIDAINASGSGLLTLTAPTIEIQADIVTTALTIDGAFVILSADLTSTGSIIFKDAVEQTLLLADDSTITSGVDISFLQNTIKGSNSLILAAPIINLDAVDGINALTINSALINLNDNVTTNGTGITFSGGDINLTGASEVTLTTFNTGDIVLNSTVNSTNANNLSFTVTDGVLSLQEISGVNNLTIDNNSVLTTLNGNIDISGTFDTTNTSDITLNGSLQLTATAGIETSNTHLASIADTNTTTLSSTGTVNIGELDTSSLSIASSLLILNGDITANTSTSNSLDFSNSKIINLNKDVTLTGNLLINDNTSSSTINSVASANNINARSLTIIGGNQDITLGLIGNTASLQSFSLTGTGALTLDATTPIPITTGSNGVSFLGNLDLGSIKAFTIDTSETNGNINLSGLNIDTAAVILKSGSGDISLGSLGSTEAIASLKTVSSGAINLHGNINNTEGKFDFSSASSIILHNNISFGSDEVFVAELFFGDATLDGNYDLDIKALKLTLGSIGQNISLQNLTINMGDVDLSMTSDVSTAGNINLTGGLISLDSAITTTGGDVTIAALTGVTMSKTTTISASDGNASISALTGDIALGSITALTEINVEATAGQIVNNINDFNSNSNTSTNLAASSINITASGSIGSSVDSPIVINAGSDGSIDLSSGNKVYVANLSNSNISSNKDIIDNTSQVTVANADAINQLKPKLQHEAHLSYLEISDPKWHSHSDENLDDDMSVPRIYYSKNGWRLGNPQ